MLYIHSVARPIEVSHAACRYECPRNLDNTVEVFFLNTRYIPKISPADDAPGRFLSFVIVAWEYIHTERMVVTSGLYGTEVQTLVVTLKLVYNEAVLSRGKGPGARNLRVPNRRSRYVATRFTKGTSSRGYLYWG